MKPKLLICCLIPVLCGGCDRKQPSPPPITKVTEQTVNMPAEPTPLPKEQGIVQPMPQSEPDSSSPSVPRSEVDALFTEATKGQPQAMHDLLTLAGNDKGDRLARETAIRYLGMDGRTESLIGVAKQLLSVDPRIRTAAYYSLPEDARPANFDYTATPNEASQKTVGDVLDKLRRSK